MGRLILCLACILALARVADADTDDKTERARVHLKAAIAYYDEARYEDAAHEMEAAYQLKPLPDLQYNLAQCYERLARYDDAAKAYETYLSQSPGAPDRKLVETRIENLRERAKAVASGQQPGVAPPAEKVVFKTIVVYKTAPPPPGRGVRYAAIGVGILGLAALGSGIAFSVLTAQAANTVTNGGNLKAQVPFDGLPAQAQVNGQTYQVVAGVSYGVAGLCALGGVGLYLLSKKIDKEAPKYSLAPSFGPSSAGFVFGGAF
jgi:tetratricopeptide (TPR) repeat protein